MLQNDACILPEMFLRDCPLVLQTEQYINNRAAFDLTAQRWTLEHATAKGPTVTSRPSSPNLTKKALQVEEGKENLPHRENSPVPDDDVPLSPTRSSSSNGSGPSGLSASVQSFTPTGRCDYWSCGPNWVSVSVQSFTPTGMCEYGFRDSDWVSSWF
jgi:hypothetical protein